MEVLKVASALSLPDWCIAAGFIRNLIWDKLHGFEYSNELDDIDLIYFEPNNAKAKYDQEMEETLRLKSGLPWSVKNQARMHIRNEDKPYTSTADAMSYWVEIEAAVGAKLNNEGDIELLAPFGLNALFTNTITLNLKRPKPDIFKQRMEDKKWLMNWPNLRVT